MKSLKVTVCNCSGCVLNGSMDIEEAIKSLNDPDLQISNNVNVKIVNEKLGTHIDEAPVVKVGRDVIEQAKPEKVMSSIVHIINQNGGND